MEYTYEQRRCFYDKNPRPFWTHQNPCPPENREFYRPFLQGVAHFAVGVLWCTFVSFGININNACGFFGAVLLGFGGGVLGGFSGSLVTCR